MKSYNHLWEKFISEENIRLAIQNSSRGKRKRNIVKRIYENPDEWIDKIKNYAENFKNIKHTPVEIYDGIVRKDYQSMIKEFQNKERRKLHHDIRL